MKFLTFATYDPAKLADITAAADKVASMPGSNILAQYMCVGQPYPGVPPNTVGGFTISEAESAEAMAARLYPVVLAGATIHVVPVMEVPVGGQVETEKKYRA